MEKVLLEIFEDEKSANARNVELGSRFGSPAYSVVTEVDEGYALFIAQTGPCKIEDLGDTIEMGLDDFQELLNVSLDDG